MDVVPCDARLEPLFWKHVYEDVPHYYFFILDTTHDRASTEILLALNEQDEIEGMMLIYKKRIVQLRGHHEAAEALLAQLDVKEVEIQGLKMHESLIRRKFKKVELAFEITLMILKKGEETPKVTHDVEQLSTEDAEDIAALMHHGDPAWWGDITGERIAAKMHERLWLGIKVDDVLVSVGGASIDEWGSNIGTVVTRESYRAKGYATSIVSSLVENILQETDLVLIHVKTDNTPAVKAYHRVGFNPYKRYVVARAKNFCSE
jgi:predicted GNAT family acetyltransferase